jgi:hypothetical protein
MATERLHLSKTITMGALLTFIILLMTQVYTYAQSQKTLTSLESISKTHVVQSELILRLEAQQYKIQTMSDDIVKIEKMVIELLQRTPKKDN